ncbi:hypothetical protein NADFUDRAFT_13253, partial [Nadsonia fulvescens var. elongata DSM 6958]
TETEEDPSRTLNFPVFISQLKQKKADPITRYIRSFLKEFSKKNWTAAEQTKIVLDFKEFIRPQIDANPLFSALSSNDLLNVYEGVEKLIMNRLYSKTFSPEIPLPARSDEHEEDVLRDNILEEKMSLFYWVNGSHLDIIPSLISNVDNFLKLASDELNKMNNYRAPRDKMVCILNACKVIFGLLRVTKSEESADSFIPLLIFVVLRAHPDHLISNMNYIQRFRDPEKLNGEAGYYLSSLQGAVSFIETLDKSQLSVSDEEFESKTELSVKLLEEKRNQKQNENQPPATPGQQNVSHKATPLSSAPTSPSGEEVTAALAPHAPSNMTPSAILLNSTGIFSSSLRSFSKIFEGDSILSEGGKDNESTGSSTSEEESAARQASAEEYEARKLQQQEHNSVVKILCEMFPGLDKDIVEDVVLEKEGRVGAAVDSCLSL